MERPPEHKPLSAGDHLALWISSFILSEVMTLSFFVDLREGSGRPDFNLIMPGVMAVAFATGFAYSYQRWHQLRDEQQSVNG